MPIKKIDKIKIAKDTFQFHKFGFSESAINFKESVFELNIRLGGILSYSTVNGKFLFNDVELMIKDEEDLGLFISFFKYESLFRL